MVHPTTIMVIPAELEAPLHFIKGFKTSKADT